MKAEPMDLQSIPFGRFGISPRAQASAYGQKEERSATLRRVELAKGVEPLTFRLQGGCSTTELR